MQLISANPAIETKMPYTLVTLFACFGGSFFVTADGLPEECSLGDLARSSQAQVGECLLQTKSSHTSKQPHDASSLPSHLIDLGKRTFGSEEALQQVVAQSTVINVKFGGTPVVLRIRGGDTAAERLGKPTEDGSDYGIDEVSTMEGSNGMINMVDLGGNYGIVTISAFKKMPDALRAVVLEPVPATYFFLCWNLHLNQVPTYYNLDPKEFRARSNEPSVVALFSGVTERTGEEIKMCAHPDWSMNAQASTAMDYACDCSTFICSTTPGISATSLFDEYYGSSEISLLKMDCEGCEFHALPALAKNPNRVKRLIGELHVPDEGLIDIACAYDNGKYVSKLCRLSESEWKSSLPLECGQARKICKWTPP